MRTLRNLITLSAAALTLWLAAACANTSMPAPPEAGDYTNLVISLSVSGTAGQSRAADEVPVHSCELMHTVRIIILNSRNEVEHNSLWDLTADPAVIAQGRPFPVEPDDDKTIIIVCNEEGTTVYDARNDRSEPAAAYFSRLYPATGAAAYSVDLEAIRALQLRTADNPVFAQDQAAERKPLPITAIYDRYHIPKTPQVDGHFYVHRAAAKYTLRLTNAKSPATVSINKARLNYVADSQWLFPHATWKDSLHSTIDAYFPLASGHSTADFTIDGDIPVGDTRDFIVYIPEGTNVMETQNTDSNRRPVITDIPYRIGLQVNHENKAIAMHDINITEAATSAAKPMKDLPRNTNVVINGSIARRESESSFVINYTVCSWWTYETDIPEYE